MTASTRVLVVTPRFPTHVDDWRARFVAGHTAALAQAFGPRNVRVAAPRRAAVAPELTHLPFAIPSTLMAPHGAPERLAHAPLRAGLGALLGTAALARVARSHRRPGQVCVAHWLVPGALAALAHGGPAVLIAHGADVALLEALPGARALLRRAGTLARFVAVSGQLADRIEALLGRPPCRPIAVLPMGIDPPSPDPTFAAEVRARAVGRPVLATVGRLVPIKGLDVLVAALARTPALRGVLWVAAGSGDEGPRLQHLARQAGLDVWFTGDLGAPARDALLAEATVFAQPSRRLPGRRGPRTEGTPVALLEALASGLPAVVTATGGMPAIMADVANECPPPVPPDDAAALAAALATALAATPAERATRRARCAAHGARYTWAHLGPLHAAVVAEAARSGVQAP